VQRCTRCAPLHTTEGAGAERDRSQGAAGLAVPVAKALIPPALEAELWRTLLQLAPTDPLGQGAAALTKALREVRQGLGA
jgi:hypothetical protein